MELELLDQRNCLERLIPQNLEYLKQDNIIFELLLSNPVPCKRPVCKDKRKAVSVTTELKI